MELRDDPLPFVFCTRHFNYTLDVPKKPKVPPPVAAAKPKPKTTDAATDDQAKNNKKIVPPVIKSNTENEFLELESGSTFDLSFEIAANSPTEINVYKDEEIIESGNEHLQIAKEGNIVKLKIDKLTTDDSGFYVIEAENEAGLTDKEIEINVKGRGSFISEKLKFLTP